MTSRHEHDGGPNPVRSGEKLVQVEFRSGNAHSVARDDGKSLRWGHVGKNGDIVAYRVAPARVDQKN